MLAKEVRCEKVAVRVKCSMLLITGTQRQDELAEERRSEQPMAFASNSHYS